MASLSFNENIKYTGKKPNFERDQFSTIEEMAKFSENYLPEVFIAMCVEDGNVYIFNKKNEKNSVTGKWRLLGGALQEEITAAFAIGGIKEGDTLGAGKSLEDIIRNMLIGEKPITAPAYYGVAAEKITNLGLLTKIESVSNFTIKVTAHNEYVIIACPIEETEVKIFNNGFDYTASFKTFEQGAYRFFYSETKITCDNFEYTITYK